MRRRAYIAPTGLNPVERKDPIKEATNSRKEVVSSFARLYCLLLRYLHGPLQGGRTSQAPSAEAMVRQGHLDTPYEAVAATAASKER